MHSDLRKLLRFTSIQTNMLLTSIFGFSCIVIFFIVFYSKTEIRTHLTRARTEIDQRTLNLDNTVRSISSHLLNLRNVSLLYMENTPPHPRMFPSPEKSDKTGRLTAFTYYGHVQDNTYSGQLITPNAILSKANDQELDREMAMAGDLFPIQYSILKSGDPIIHSYYYSNRYKFFTTYPAFADQSPVSMEEILEKFRQVSTQDRLKNNDTPFWVGPFSEKNSNRHTLINAVQLFKNNSLIGYLVNEIYTDSLSPFTKPIFEEKGMVFLVSRDGRLITKPWAASPETKPVFPGTLEAALPPGLSELNNELLQGNSRSYLFQNGFLAMTGELNYVPWRLVYIISFRDFAISMLPRMGVYVLSIITAIVMFVFGLFIIVTRYIKPTHLAKTALQKAHDELEMRVKERTAELIRKNEELKESREKYRQLFIHAPAGIYEIDFVTGRFVSVNDVLCEYTGYTPKEFLNLSPFALLTKHGRAVIEERLAKVMRGEKISRNVEIDIVTKSGSRMAVVLNNSFVIKDGRITGSRVVIHDISERKIAEKALKQSEERFRNLVESTSDWIWEIDREGQFIYNSPSVETITGYRPKDLQGDRFLNYFPVFEHEKLFQMTYGSVRTGSIPAPVECCIQHKNGELLTIESRGVSYYDENGMMLGTRGISRDITEKKKNDQEKAEFQKILDRAKKMEALGLLAGGVAHDLNNILSGIINYPELILLDLPRTSPMRDQINAIYMSGKKAAAIVDDLITVARGAARKKEIVNLNSVIDEYLHSAEYNSMSSQNPSVDITVNLDNDLINITTSPVQIRKALLNLVINAVEAVQSQGNVRIITRNEILTEPLKGFDEIPPGRYVVLCVEDTGTGISPEDLERIFEPFYSKKVMGRSGTGLGLAIVWNTVTENGGHIQVISSSNGSAFNLYFPSTDTQASEKKKGLKIKDYMGHGEKVLVVDDETIQREIASQLLNTLDYSPIALDSGEKAVDFLKQEKVDVILLDMVMEPGMSGRETYEKIIELHPEQKVIITTGYADTAEVRKAQEKGAGELLKKPYTLEELGLAIERQLQDPPYP